MKFLLIIPVILFLIRISRGYFASNVETPDYKVIQSYTNCKIREIPSKIYATVSVTGSETQATNNAFGILAGFIFWGNKSRASIAMTAPVISQQSSEKIAMTAPVVSTQTKEWVYAVSFLMPSGYTMDTLPIPNDNRITITQKPAQQVAAIQFAGYATQGNIDNYRNKLIEACKQNNISTTGSSIVAQYNDPRTPRFMRRNEIWITVQ